MAVAEVTESNRTTGTMGENRPLTHPCDARVRVEATFARSGHPQSLAWMFEGQTLRQATDDESFAMARCLWPVLAEVENVDDWEKVVDTLLNAELPVGVYDLAVDVLHARLHLPSSDAVAVMTRDQVIDALRQSGWNGRVTTTTLAKLRQTLELVRRGLQ